MAFEKLKCDFEFCSYNYGHVCTYSKHNDCLYYKLLKEMEKENG